MKIPILLHQELRKGLTTCEREGGTRKFPGYQVLMNRRYYWHLWRLRIAIDILQSIQGFINYVDYEDDYTYNQLESIVTRLKSLHKLLVAMQTRVVANTPHS